MNRITYSGYNNKKKIIYNFIILLTLSVVFFVLSMCIGSIRISLSALWKVFGNHNANATFIAIVYEIRMPRTLAAIMLGGALALSGYLLQTFFQNLLEHPQKHPNTWT